MAADQPGIDERICRRFAPLGTTLTVRRHAVIHAAGQPARSLFIVATGQVGQQMVSAEGRVLTLRVLEPGQAFGLESIGSATQYESVATALTPVRVLVVPQAALLSELARDSSLLLDLVELLGLYRRQVSRRIDEVAFKSVPARLASVLLELSENSTQPPTPHVARRTHQQLADMVNAYRETVTKIINQFRDARLLRVDREGITLLNPSRLRELAQNQLSTGIAAETVRAAATAAARTVFPETETQRPTGRRRWLRPTTSFHQRPTS